MNVKPRLGKSDSKKTLNSMWMENDAMNDSADEDSQDMIENKKGAKVHLIQSIFKDRPATIFFKYPKCCGIEQTVNERVYCNQKIQLYYKISGSEYKCIVNSL